MRILWIHFLLLLLFVGVSCNITPEGPIDEQLLLAEVRRFRQNPDSIGFIYLKPTYQMLGQSMVLGGTWVLQETSSDELIPFNQGSNWGTDPEWQAMIDHDFSPDLGKLNAAWFEMGLMKGRLDVSHQIFEGSENDSLAKYIVAEHDILEAYINWLFIDLFGQIPGGDLDQPNGSSALQRPEATMQTIDLLEAAIPNAREKADFTGQEALYRANKWTAKALLARLYLNKFVYLSEGAPATSDMDNVVSLCDEIIASGVYTLSEDYWSTFSGTNGDDPQKAGELILAGMPNEGKTSSNQYAISALAPPHFLNQSNWQYYISISEFYEAWDTLDPRFKGPWIPEIRAFQGFNAFQQYDNNGDILRDETDVPVYYEPTIDPFIINPYQGARAVKNAPFFFSLAIDPFGGKSMVSLIRMGEIMLMKAEAQYRKGESGLALGTLNELREKRGAKLLGEVSEEILLKEYGFELWWEGQRRTHQIRFGTFNRELSVRPVETDPSRRLYPIPTSALDNNPELEQNPGY